VATESDPRFLATSVAEKIMVMQTIPTRRSNFVKSNP
jgi:hypothetical protein